MKTSRVLLVVGSIATAALLISIPKLTSIYKDFADKSYESSGKSNLSLIVSAQNAYREQWNKYSDDVKELGFKPEGEIYKIYFHDEELPENFRSALSTQEWPFVKEDSFQILLAMDSRDKKRTIFWLANDTYGVMQLSTSLAKEP